MITVVNVRRTRVGVHYVGRACGGFRASALANQWRRQAVGGKEQAIQLYREWLFGVMQRGALRDESCPAWEELYQLALSHRRGEDIQLGCWCAPAACHAEVVREVIQLLVDHELV
jgi:hypothetical protein